MSQRCLECGKRRAIFGKNYAGLDVRQAVRNSNTFGFPERYEALTLPGDPQKDFLCAKCANSRTVVCSVHGPIKDKFSMGYPPLCVDCQYEDRDKKAHPHTQRVHSLSSDKCDSLRFTDPKHNFTIDIPEGWKAQPLVEKFDRTGGRVAFQAPNGQAIVNVSVGTLDRPEWADLSLRRKSMVDFLQRARARYANDWWEDMGEIQLGGEKNTVGFVHRNAQGYARIVSAYHDGLEYVIQSQDNLNREYEVVINRIISSFQF